MEGSHPPSHLELSPWMDRLVDLNSDLNLNVLGRGGPCVVALDQRKDLIFERDEISVSRGKVTRGSSAPLIKPLLIGILFRLVLLLRERNETKRNESVFSFVESGSFQK